MKNGIRRSIWKNEGALRSAGFTIIELMLVIGIGLLLLALTTPVGLRFYQLQVADETALDLESAVRTAHSEARLGRNAHASGIKFLPGSYVRFEGMSYDSRDPSYDVSTVLPSGTRVVPFSDEIVFTSVTGFPNATGSIVVTLFGKTSTLTINELGVISGE